MKKKILVCLLIAVLMLGLSGCGAFELSLAKAVKSMASVQSFRTDFRLDLETVVSILGDDSEVNAVASGTAALTLQPFRIGADVELESFGEDLSVKLVVAPGNSGFDVYYSLDGGNRWQKTEAEVNLPASNTEVNINAAVLLKLAQLGKSFQKAGTQTVHGSEAVIWSGSISGEDLAKLLEESGWSGLQTENGIAVTPDTFRQISGIPIRIGIDTKSGMITFLSVDLTEFSQIAMRELITPIIQENLRGRLGLLEVFGLDWENLGFELSIGKTLLEMELYDFDQVGSIAIPSV